MSSPSKSSPPPPLLSRSVSPSAPPSPLVFALPPPPSSSSSSPSLSSPSSVPPSPSHSLPPSPLLSSPSTTISPLSPVPPSLQLAFFKLQFVSTVPRNSQCLICGELLNNPHLTSCCRQHYCKDCINRMFLAKKPCLKCKAEKFTISPNLALKAKINSLRVFCPMKQSGCKWNGPLEMLDTHMSLGVSEGDCQYMHVPCPERCGKQTRRGDMKTHLNTACSSRRIFCQFCGMEDSYYEIKNTHPKICHKLPVDCPKGCEMPGIERCALQTHIETECPLRVVQCDFALAGCKSDVISTELSRHLKENVDVHLSQVLTLCKQLRDENLTLKRQYLDTVENCVNLRSDVMHLKTAVMELNTEVASLKFKIPHPIPILDDSESDYSD